MSHSQKRLETRSQENLKAVCQAIVEAVRTAVRNSRSLEDQE